LTAALCKPSLGNMEVHLSPELQAKVERAAAESKSGAEEYVKQLVEHYVDHDAWFRQQVTRGLEHLDRGEFLTHEEVGARIDQMFRK
jgi:predicted transcriptional regulator